LVTIGVCKRIGKDQFALTAMGGHLAGKAQHSLKAWALFEGELLARSWSGLLDSIRTGKTAAQLAGIDNSFDLMAHDPARAQLFDEGMVALTRQVIPAVLAAYDFSGSARLIDVGGGYGELLCAILTACPSMRGAIFDMPRCAEGAKRQLSDAGLTDRGEFIAGSFFESVPSGADAVIMKSIIHDWDDERSVKILQNCRRALAAGGKLLLVERIMPEIPEANTEHCSVTLSDLNMLRGPGGSERTEREYRELLSKSGFKMACVLPGGRWNVIEAMVG
jgi:SAM-dependent methyltransferase